MTKNEFSGSERPTPHTQSFLRGIRILIRLQILLAELQWQT